MDVELRLLIDNSDQEYGGADPTETMVDCCDHSQFDRTVSLDGTILQGPPGACYRAFLDMAKQLEDSAGDFGMEADFPPCNLTACPEQLVDTPAEQYARMQSRQFKKYSQWVECVVQFVERKKKNDS